MVFARYKDLLRNARMVMVACAWGIAGCATSRQETALQRFEFEQPQMGVPFRMVLYARNSEIAEVAAQAAFDRVAKLNAVMSDYETDSELSKLSRSSEEGSPEVPVSDDLWNVLVISQKLSRDTKGAFDITVGPVVAFWRRARREERLPDPARLQNALSKVGYTNLVLNEQRHTARLLKRGMRLDLGGIAKGYAADEALHVLQAHGIRRALVAASGDLSLGDPPPGEKGWRVELIGYDAPGGPRPIVTKLANKGVSSSGDLSQRVEINGVRYSHILNPFTGIGMTNHALATVIAKNCTTSDTLDTVCAMLDPEDALALARKYSAEARVVRVQDAQLQIRMTEGFPEQ